MRPISALFEEIQRAIDRNAIDPGEETRVAFETWQCVVRLDERFLGEVGRIFVIGGHVVDRGIDAFLVPTDQEVECSEVSALGS